MTAPLLGPFAAWGRLCGLPQWRVDLAGWARHSGRENLATSLDVWAPPFHVGPEWPLAVAVVLAGIWTAWAYDHRAELYRYYRLQSHTGFLRKRTVTQATFRHTISLMAFPWVVLGLATVVLAAASTVWPLVGPLTLVPFTWALRLRWRLRRRRVPQG